MAYINVSASGPEFSAVLAQDMRLGLRRRMAADLEFTTSDTDFLHTYFKTDNYDAGDKEIHFRLVNPTLSRVRKCFDKATKWLMGFRNEIDWDGGGVQFVFAGHGCEDTGSLVLKDGELSSGEFINLLKKMNEESIDEKRLRVSIVLDSCHSGAFMLDVLDACMTYKSMVGFHLFASCMPDEAAFEDSGLAHGLFTYCISVKRPYLGAISASAIQGNNVWGPSLAIAGGESGCSLLTAGMQNPLSYWNGSGEVQVAGNPIPIFDADGEYVGKDAILKSIKIERDLVVGQIQLIRRDVSPTEKMSDEDYREELREAKARLMRENAPTDAGA